MKRILNFATVYIFVLGLFSAHNKDDGIFQEIHDTTEGPDVTQFETLSKEDTLINDVDLVVSDDFIDSEKAMAADKMMNTHANFAAIDELS